MVNIQEKIKQELKIDKPTKVYRDREVGQIIDILIQEIEDLKSRLNTLETK